jgi:hypothetical protein
MTRLVRRSLPLAVAALLLLLPPPSRADDLSSQQLLLCTAVTAMHCHDDGTCVVDVPWNLNIPQFLVVNLEKKTISTTKASGENRSTPIRSIQREGGQIILQGLEGGRAFSFVIDEASGLLSVGMAAEGRVVSVFGACTPLAQEK